MAVAPDLSATAGADDPASATVRTRTAALREHVLEYLPRGNLLSDEVWQRRHTILQWLLLLHLPVLILFGFWMRHSAPTVLLTVTPIALFRLLGALPSGRRAASFCTTAGIVYSAAALVLLADGATEAHFHFFIVIGFLALYQDWLALGWNVVFTVLSLGLGSALEPDLMFDHDAAIGSPWTWALIHGLAVLAASVGVLLFWRTNEDEQRRALALSQELSDLEIGRRRFASDLLVNLARRNQSLLYRQLDIINQLEHAERDPDALAGLFRLDHLATRIRRNAENLLVLAGEEGPRVWGRPVPLSDVVRAAIAETEDLSRVSFVVDERLTVLGRAVVDLTHLLAELIENAVRSSPPQSQVTIRTTPDVRAPDTVMLTVEDWGVGMPADQLAEANLILAAPRDVDELTPNRLGLHVIARLAHRYAVKVVLAATPGSGITAIVLLPYELFTPGDPARSGSPSGPPAVPRPVVHAGAQNGSAGLPDTASIPLPQRSPGSSGPLDPSDGFHRTGAEPNTDAVESVKSDKSVAGTASGSGLKLNRRKPQTHLAPELKRDRPGADDQADVEPATPPPAPPLDAARAREALSRYQASRQAALAEPDPEERNPR
jgi:signal transduction histidine kinase